jgi:hypothetical protein
MCRGAVAEGAGFEPAADISASDRFQGGSDRPLRHPSERTGPGGRAPGRSLGRGRRLLRSADLQLDVVVGEVVKPLAMVVDVDQESAQLRGQAVDVGGHEHL